MTEVVSKTARGEFVTGCGNVWMPNQFSAESEAYANASSADAKFGTSILPEISTCPRKVSPVLGLVMVTGV